MSRDGRLVLPTKAHALQYRPQPHLVLYSFSLLATLSFCKSDPSQRRQQAGNLMLTAALTSSRSCLAETPCVLLLRLQPHKPYLYVQLVHFAC